MSESEVIQFSRDNLARFKVPKTVIFGSLEKTSTGKVQKYLLREIAENHVVSGAAFALGLDSPSGKGGA